MVTYWYKMGLLLAWKDSIDINVQKVSTVLKGIICVCMCNLGQKIYTHEWFWILGAISIGDLLVTGQKHDKEVPLAVADIFHIILDNQLRIRR